MWYTWASDTTAIGSRSRTIRAPVVARAPLQPTAAQRRRAQRQARKAKVRAAMAESRAEELLKALLTPEQWAAFKADRKFHLVTKDGNRFEVDCNKRMHNVFELDNDNRRRIEHCIYAAGDVPMADNVAAQILLLQDDEKEFKRIANQTRLIA